MAQPRVGRYIDKPGGKNVDSNIVGRSQGFLSQAVAPDADLDMDVVEPQAAIMAQAILTGGDQLADAFAKRIGIIASGSDDTAFETVRRALEMIDEQRPGYAGQLVANAGSPDSLAMEFPAAANVDPGASAADPTARVRGPQAYTQNVPVLERLSTYGGGTKGPPRQKDLTQLAMPESRTKRERVGDGSKDWQRRQDEYNQHERLYRGARDIQLERLAGVPMSPELVAQLTTRQISGILSVTTGRKPDAVTPELAEGLIGMPLTAEAARYLTRPQRDFLVGPVDFGSLTDADVAGMGQIQRGANNKNSIGNDFAQMRMDVSEQDQKALALRKIASEGGSLDPRTLEAYFPEVRYQFPTAQGGQIVRPGLAPAGDFIARWTRGTLRQWDDPSWVSTMAPIFDQSVRQLAPLPPSTKTFRNMPGVMSPQSFADLLLPPNRGGAALLKAEREGGMPFQQFTEAPMNYGRDKPFDLTRALLDPADAPATPDPTISTPDAVAPPPPDAPSQPPVMPADDELSMYMPQRLPPSVLAALLA